MRPRGQEGLLDHLVQAVARHHVVAHHLLLGGPRREDDGRDARCLERPHLLAQRPKVLFLDEPTAALDLGHAQQVLDLLDRLRRQDGLTVVSTLHDLTLAGQYADRLTLLAAGRVVAEGTPAEVLTPAALAEHYGARAQVVSGPDGLAVLPVR